MRTDVQTDMTKLIVAFYNFANAPKTVPSNGDWMPVCVYSVTTQRHVLQPDGHISQCTVILN